MMVRENWDVLVVDDDPDVLAVTRLALKQIQVYGIPLRLHECNNGASAIEYLRKTAELSDLALAIVDVVMESDHAGLDVCKVIREELRNRVTPIVVRTGHAGKAPEREVIERYDISTYLTKVEATNEKLFTTVVSAVRNYQHAVASMAGLELMAWLISQPREGIADTIRAVDRLLTRRDGTAPQGARYHFCVVTDREVIAVGNFVGREAEGRRLYDQLTSEPGRRVNSQGDRFVHSGKHVLFLPAPIEGVPTFGLLGETNYRTVPDHLVRQSLVTTKAIRTKMQIA